MIHSDEGLTLETSVLWLIIYFSVTLFFDNYYETNAQRVFGVQWLQRCHCPYSSIIKAAF